MRLKSISFRGLVRFTSAVPTTVDVDAIGPGLIALVGRNGEGKTSALEAVVAAVYGILPSRDSWYDYWTGRDGFAEAVFEDDGHELKARVQVDAERRTTEKYLILDGQPLTTGRAREFEAEVQRRFGSYELFVASVFGAQKKTGDFLAAPKSQRKDRFAELLNLGRLQRLHEQAKEERSKAELELATARNDLGVVQAQAAMFPELEAAAAGARTAADAAAHKLEGARTEEASAVAALERARGAQERLATLETAFRAADRALGDARAALVVAVEAEPKANRAAEQRRAGLKLQDPDARMEHALEQFAAATKRIAGRQSELEATLRERPVLEEARKRADELATETVALEAADRAWERAQDGLRTAQHARAAAHQRAMDAMATVERDRSRLDGEASLLERVPCTEAEGWVPSNARRSGILANLAGTCPLLSSARGAKDRAAALKVDVSLATALDAAIAAEATARQRLEETLAATDTFRLAEIRAELPLLQEKAARLPHLEEARTQLHRLIDELEATNAGHSREIKAIEELRGRLQADRQSIENDLKGAIAEARNGVTQAQGRLDLCVAAADNAKVALATARKEGALTVPQAEASLSAARTTRYKAEQDLRAADQVLAAATAKHEQLREHLAALPELEATARAAEQELGDWALLAQALGRDGIQALEIDAAGPEVARLCNALLEACYGTRWSVTFETLREKRDGTFAEAFDIGILDEGRERSVEGISGGERVWIGEAIALSLAIFNARKSGINHKTLYRDEPGAALDPANSSAYCDLLRRALALGGFVNVLFVSHREEAWARADVRLVVAGGRVTVEGAPAAARAEAVA